MWYVPLLLDCKGLHPCKILWIRHISVVHCKICHSVLLTVGKLSVCCSVQFIIRYFRLWASYQFRTVCNVSFIIAYCGPTISFVQCTICHSVLPTMGQLSVSCSVQFVIRYCLIWPALSVVQFKICHSVLPIVGQLSVSCSVQCVIHYCLLWASYQCRAVYNLSFGIAYYGPAFSVVQCTICHSVLPTVGQLSVSCSVQFLIRYYLLWSRYQCRAVYNFSFGINYCGLAIIEVQCTVCYSVLPSVRQLSVLCSVQRVIRYCLLCASYQCRAVYNVSFGIAYFGLAISVVLCTMCHSVLPTVS